MNETESEVFLAGRPELELPPDFFDEMELEVLVDDLGEIVTEAPEIGVSEGTR